MAGTARDYMNAAIAGDTDKAGTASETNIVTYVVATITIARATTMAATITGTDGIGEDPVSSNSYNKQEVASLGGLVTRCDS